MKILIFTASAGGGHNSAARVIKEELLNRNNNYEIEIVDAFTEYAGKLNNWIIQKGYFLSCKYAVDLYNIGFSIKEKKDFSKNNSGKSIYQGYSIMGNMLKKILDFQPDVIFSTYVFCSIALSNLRRVYKIPATIMTLTLDYGVSPYWERCLNIDKMFITSREMEQQFINKGFEKNKLIISGIPVSKKFFLEKDEGLKEKLQLKENVFTVLIMKASFFPISTLRLINEIKKIKEKCQVVIINGNSIKEKKKIDRLIKNNKLGKNVINLGFVNNIFDYIKSADIILGKCGGLTSTEAVSTGVPLFVLDKLPKQEKINAQYLSNKGCVKIIKNNEIAFTINNVIVNSNVLKKMKEASREFRDKKSIDIICEEIEKQTKKERQIDGNGDSVKEIRKKVNKKIKEEIKNKSRLN